MERYSVGSKKPSAESARDHIAEPEAFQPSATQNPQFAAIK
jgi:hypothetical protein